MYLFSLHPSKVKDCFQPHFTTDKGNFVVEETSKGWAAMATTQGLGGAFRACEAHAGTGSQLSAPGWGQSKPPWACLSSPLVLQGRCSWKKIAQRWRVTAFLRLFESLGNVCRGSVRSTWNKGNTHRLQPHFRPAPTSCLRVLRWAEELQVCRCF